MLPSGDVISDSWDIATWAGLDPPDEEFKITLDTVVGPLSRQYAYSFFLKKSNENIFAGLCLTSNHWFFKLMWWLGLKFIVIKVMNKFFRPTDVAAVALCREKLVSAVGTIGIEKIAKRSGKYIMGDKLTQADLALAALMAPLLCPPLYALGTYDQWFKLAEAQDNQLKEEVLYWRSTEVGKYVMQIYRNERHRVL